MGCLVCVQIRVGELELARRRQGKEMKPRCCRDLNITGTELSPKAATSESQGYLLIPRFYGPRVMDWDRDRW